MTQQIGDDLEQVAPNGDMYFFHQVPTLADRDRIGANGTMRVGHYCFVDGDQWYELLTTTPTFAARGTTPTPGGGVGGMTRVADQAARDAYTGSAMLGELVYQEDFQIIWQLRDDNGAGAIWHAWRMAPVEDTLFGGGFSVIYMYLDEAGGSDLNDGRTPLTAKQTWRGIIQDLNDAGDITGKVEFGFPPYVQVFVSPSLLYTGANFGDISLYSAIPGGLYFIADFVNFANTEVLTVSADNGLITLADGSQSTSERDLTTNAFANFGPGERLIWTGSPIFPGIGPATRPSTTPNLRVCSSNNPFLTTFNMEQYEILLTLNNGCGIEAYDPNTTIYLYGIQVDNASAFSLPTFRNVSWGASLLTNSGGGSVLFVRGDGGFASFIGSQVNIGSGNTLQVDLPTNNANQFVIQRSVFGDFIFSMFSGQIFPNGGLVFEGLLQGGGFGSSSGGPVFGNMGPGDYLNPGAGPIIRLNSLASVRQIGDWAFPAATGTLVQVDDGGQLTREVGDIRAQGAGLVGPALRVTDGAQYLGASGYAGIVTTPVGSDIQLGTQAAIALAGLPANDFAVGAASQGVRAS